MRWIKAKSSWLIVSLSDRFSGPVLVISWCGASDVRILRETYKVSASDSAAHPA